MNIHPPRAVPPRRLPPPPVLPPGVLIHGLLALQLYLVHESLRRSDQATSFICTMFSIPFLGLYILYYVAPATPPTAFVSPEMLIHGILALSVLLLYRVLAAATFEAAAGNLAALVYTSVVGGGFYIGYYFVENWN